MRPKGTSRARAVPQGWYKDPFGMHDARWFTNGRPTALVRDGAEVLRDRVLPEGDCPGPLEPYEAIAVPAPALPSDPERWLAENFPERTSRLMFGPWWWLKFLLGRLPDWFYPWRKIDRS